MPPVLAVARGADLATAKRSSVRLTVHEVEEACTRFRFFEVLTQAAAESRRPQSIQCPLYPRKRTFAVHKPMSAKCQ